MSIRAVSRSFLFCAVFFLVIAGGISLYASAYIGELHRQTLAPESAPSVRAGLLRQIERSMGMRGAGGAYARFVQTGQPAALRDAANYLQTAEQVIGLYAEHNAPGSAQDGVKDLRTLLGNFRTLYGQAASAGANQTVQNGVQTALGQLTSLLRTLHDREVMTRFDSASRILSYGQGTILLLLLGVFAMTLAIAIISRTRFFEPLEMLGRDVHDLGIATENGTPSDTPVWGVDRQDEIGALARAVERLRRRTEQIPTSESSNEQDGTGAMTVNLTGPSGEILDSVLNELREAAKDMVRNSASLEVARDENVAAMAENAERTAGVVETLKGLHGDLGSLLTDGRRSFSQLTTHIQDVTTQVSQAEDSIKATAGRVVERLTGDSEALSVQMQTTVQVVSDAAETIEGSRVCIAEAGTAAQSARDLFAEVPDRLKETVLVPVDSARSDAARLSETITALTQETARTAQALRTNAAMLDDTSHRVLDRIADTAGQVEAIAGRFAVADDRREEAETTPATMSMELAAALRDLSELIVTKLDGLREEAARQNGVIEGIDAQVGQNADALGDMGNSLRDVADQLLAGSDAVHTVTGRFDEVVGGIAESLTQIVGQVGKAVDDHDTTQAALSRHQGEMRDLIQSVSTRLDGLGETIEASAVAVQSNNQTDTEQEIIPVTDLRQCIEDALAPFAQDLTVKADDAPTVEVSSLLNGLVQQIGSLTSRVDDLAGREDPPVTDLSGVETRMTALSEQIDSLMTAAPTGPDAVSEQISGLSEEIVALSERMTALSEAVSQEAATESPALDFDALRTMSQSIEANTTALLERIAEGGHASPTDDLDPAIASLKALSGTMQETKASGQNPSSLTATAKDITMLAEVIQGLEQRATTLARHLANGGMLEDGMAGPAGEAVTDEALRQLQGATEKLGNIATAIAIASDANRLRAAS